MQTSGPCIVAAERMGEGVFVEFDDGKSAVYSASLLYASLWLAEALNVPDLEEELETGDD